VPYYPDQHQISYHAYSPVVEYVVEQRPTQPQTLAEPVKPYIVQQGNDTLDWDEVQYAVPGIADYFYEHVAYGPKRQAVVIMNPGPANMQPGYDQSPDYAQDPSDSFPFGLQFGSSCSPVTYSGPTVPLALSGDLERAPCPSFASALYAASKRHSAKAAREALIKTGQREREVRKRLRQKIRKGEPSEASVGTEEDSSTLTSSTRRL
jgi:hypothetical protein